MRLIRSEIKEGFAGSEAFLFLKIRRLRRAKVKYKEPKYQGRRLRRQNSIPQATDRKAERLVVVGPA